mmetsp:Transcript_44772/g.103750  ORF Transcript_44772/g.103750 Transcript_44772/m.103750 type:complete len:221 (-) Transcript_44772:941-1603(-)
MAWTNFPPNDFTFAQPASPILPLPSKMRTMSNLDLHFNVSPVFGLHTAELQRLYCKRTSESGLGQLPWPLASTPMSRLRTWKPPSHALEHEDHLVHSESVQSRSQAPALHMALSEVASHGRPPLLGCLRMDRTRSMMPPPHCALQELQPPHCDKEQSVGQACTLQRLFITKGGQAAPRLAGTTTERTIFCTPPPQGSLHSSGIHGDTSQSWMKGLLASIL